ncbi:MAG TPA: hypothetical protein VK183_12940 [Flavobacterium sp.]|nr:hypothetical protein [Flavobacterium sp.]
MVRNKTKVEINKALDGHKYFSSSDFSVEYKGYTISIRYEYDSRFYFIINLPEQISTRKVETQQQSLLSMRSTLQSQEVEVYLINVKMSPGQMVLSENVEFESSKLRSNINSWLTTIWEELNSQPLSKRLDEQNDILNEIKSRVDQVSEEYFSREEGEEIKQKLKDLEAQIKAQIEQQVTEKKEQGEKIKELHQYIEVLTDTVYLLNKKNWFKSSMTKMYKWISNESNRKLLKDGAELLKPLLPESVKDIVE